MVLGKFWGILGEFLGGLMGILGRFFGELWGILGRFCGDFEGFFGRFLRRLKIIIYCGKNLKARSLGIFCEKGFVFGRVLCGLGTLRN